MQNEALKLEQQLLGNKIKKCNFFLLFVILFISKHLLLGKKYLSKSNKILPQFKMYNNTLAQKSLDSEF